MFHAAGEPVLAHVLARQVRGGLEEGWEVGGDAQIGEEDPRRTLPGLVPVEDQPHRHCGRAWMRLGR